MYSFGGMSAQDFALKRAAELVEDDPGAAFDLILASGELDRTAAKDPAVVTLNRSMRGIKTAAIKYLMREVPDLVWDAGSNFDYIGLGTTVWYTGSAEAKGPASIRIKVDYIKPNAQYDKPGEYSVRLVTEGKGGREIYAGRVVGTIEDLKRKPAMWLAKSAEAAERHLKGSLDAEKTELLAAMDEAITAYKDIGPKLKAARKSLEGTKNLLADAPTINRALEDIAIYELNSPVERVSRLLNRITQAGG